MAIPDSHTKESLSSAFVRAIVAKARQSLNITRESDYGVDGVIHQIELLNGKYRPTGPLFNFQLKATVNYTKKESDISYRLEAEAYNDCVHWRGPIPMVLVVYCMPRDEVLWCNLTEDCLMLKSCAYWTFMNVDSLVKSARVIKLPRKQIFDEKAVLHILEIAKQATRVRLDFDRLSNFE